MILIKLSDFVLKQSEKIMNLQITHLESHNEIVNYTKFLKQPLKPEMFVPCDENGLFLDYLNDFENNKKYKKAQEKILFNITNCKFTLRRQSKNKSIDFKKISFCYHEIENTLELFFENDIIKFSKPIDILKIECLANNFPIIELTDSATKQFLTK